MDTMTEDEVIRFAQATCDALSDEDDTLKREVLTHAGNRWSLGIVHALGPTAHCAMPSLAGACRVSRNAC